MGTDRWHLSFSLLSGEHQLSPVIRICFPCFAVWPMQTAVAELAYPWESLDTLPPHTSLRLVAVAHAPQCSTECTIHRCKRRTYIPHHFALGICSARMVKHLQCCCYCQVQSRICSSEVQP